MFVYFLFSYIQPWAFARKTETPPPMHVEEARNNNRKIIKELLFVIIDQI